MSEFMFSCGNKKLSAKARATMRRIAKAHDVRFVYIPDNTPNWTASRYWFAKENLGSMHDLPVARAVQQDIDRLLKDQS